MHDLGKVSGAVGHGWQAGRMRSRIVVRVVLGSGVVSNVHLLSGSLTGYGSLRWSNAMFVLDVSDWQNTLHN